MGEGSDALESSSLGTPYYHEFGDPSIIMDKEQMLQLLDSPDSTSMFTTPTEDSKVSKIKGIHRRMAPDCTRTRRILLVPRGNPEA